MSNMKMQRQQTILTEDGELKEVEATSSRVETLYCIHCGTANRSIASFCRNCGQALDDELDTHTGSGIKTKRSAGREQVVAHAMSVPGMVFNLLKIAVVGSTVMIIATDSDASFWSYILAAVFVGAWFMVEAAQAGVFTGGK